MNRVNLCSFAVFSMAWFAIVLGCTSTPGRKLNTGGVQSATEYSQADIRKLRSKSDAGDGNAAFSLFWYYALTQPDPAKERFFYQRALALNWPPALYHEARMIWSHEKKPDIARVDKLASRAVSLGCADALQLLKEVREAERTGKIPDVTEFRYFP